MSERRRERLATEGQAGLREARDGGARERDVARSARPDEEYRSSNWHKLPKCGTCHVSFGRAHGLIPGMNRQTSDVPLDFEQLVRDHSGRIRRIARRFAADGTVDDLVQDILTRLWRSFAGFRGDAKVESWIYRVALNAAMTHVTETVKARDLQAAVSAQSVATEGVPGGASAANILSDFLSQLGDVDASILMMYMDGLTADEMSGVLGITGNAINVRLNRMKQKFTDAYVE
jgi:RNA polymerase sigma-70 factor (ECF subfamily)